MTRSYLAPVTAAFMFTVAVSSAQPEPSSVPESGSDSPQSERQRPRRRIEYTEAYKRESLRVRLEAINRIAQDLELPEKLPITTNDLRLVDIAPPTAYIHAGILGTIDTRNYCYVVKGAAISDIVIKNHAGTFLEAKAKYLWPKSRIDKNAAFQVVTQLLAKAEIDVASLGRECEVQIRVSGPYKLFYYVPDYWINWKKAGTNVMFVEFLEPTKTIRQLVIYDTAYARARWIVLTNLVELLTPENPRQAVIDEIEFAATTNMVRKRELAEKLSIRSKLALQRTAPHLVDILSRANAPVQTNLAANTNLPPKSDH